MPYNNFFFSCIHIHLWNKRKILLGSFFFYFSLLAQYVVHISVSVAMKLELLSCHLTIKKKTTRTKRISSLLVYNVFDANRSTIRTLTTLDLISRVNSCATVNKVMRCGH